MDRPVRRRPRWVELFTGPTPPIRTVELAPPSQAEEGVWVFLTACFVCLFVIYVIAFQRQGRGPDAARASQVLGFQVLFRDLPSAEQRVFRSMQEGTTEALRLRAESGTWPGVETLAGAGVPPFARDVLDKAALVWTQQRDGLLNEYVGIPSAAGAPSFLVLVQEPPPAGGETPRPGTVDEEHQLLADGRLLHVTYWKRSPPAPRATVVADPALAGWQQVRITSPFQPEGTS